MVSRTKRSVDEANSRSSIVEAGKWTCKSSDVGIKRPHWHTLMFEGEVRIDMRHVRLKDVKKRFCSGQRQSTGRSGWSQLWPCCERRRWESGLKRSKRCQKSSSGRRVGAAKKCFDIGWSDKSECQACQGTEKHKLYHCAEWYEVRRKIPKAFRKWEQKAKTSKK